MAVISSKRVGRNSFSMKRTSDWVMSIDVPTDVNVQVSGTSFALHKFPLVSRSGRIRKLIAEASSVNLDSSHIELDGIPGGCEAFILAAKFCYGVHVEITASNVAMLRCAAEYLEMTDNYGESNLVSRTEAFLENVVVHSFGSSVTVLHSCERLLPMAEDLKIVSRCIEAAGSKACYCIDPKQADTDWWAEELCILNLDFYQRTVSVMRSQGMPQEKLWASLMQYAKHALEGFDSSNKDSGLEHEQRMLVETIVSMLPSDKRAASCGFLFGLLRTATILDTTVGCRLELERRISAQLEEATLDDLLMPSFSFGTDTLFDVDLVHRLLHGFLQHHLQNETKSSQTSLIRVAKVLDAYLAEVAPDANLKLSKFIALAELIPEHARAVEDSLYRAIDIFLKAHPSLGDVDRKKVCKLMDPQRLSPEACGHVAQNERLPTHFIIQVLYLEQLKIKSTLNNLIQRSPESNIKNVPPSRPPEPTQSVLRKENRELKLELSKMRLRLSDLEKDQMFQTRPSEDKSGSIASSVSSSPGSGKIFQTFSRRLGRLNPFGRSSLGKPPATPEAQKTRNRRHSIS